jgi:hypothetical protein
MNTNSEIYQFLKTVNGVRKETKYQQFNQIERYSYSNFYCFSRGSTTFAFTNQFKSIHYSVPYNPYKTGDKVCNIFWPGDCQTIQNGSLEVYLLNGEVKIFVPSTTAEKIWAKLNITK